MAFSSVFSKKTNFMISSHSMALASAIILFGCGQNSPKTETSDLEFVRSRADSQRYAYLEARDLEDTFIFGGSVIKATDFQSGALNMVLRPVKVKLKQSGSAASGRKLDVVELEQNQALMSFDLASRGQRFEVDFASAGNDLKLKSLVNAVGGVFTAGSRDGLWLSSGAPRVLNVSQDADNVVFDLEHTVRQARTTTDFFGRTRIAEILSEHPGTVVVRLYLKRQKNLPRLTAAARTVASGKSKSIGFFGADFVGENDNIPIQRYNVGDARDRVDHITYYLKDVPAAYQAIARQAVLSWNAAFGSEVLSVEIAPEGIDVGDPRYHVIKWFDGTDNSLGWAGVAKMIVDPDSGLVLSGSLYVQGDTLIRMYTDIVGFSEQVTQAPVRRLVGSIGNVDFSHDAGENPVAPFLTNVARDFDSYMQNYYLETIAHEVGHTLGLRHNFRGSTQLVNGESASVMDYAPRSERDKYTGPGFYDLAAIRWAYFGEEPRQSLPFCTDEDIWKVVDCSQGDWGDSVDNTVRSLIDGTMLLAQKPIAITTDEQISSMGGALENAYKIKKLVSQLPAAGRTQTVTNITAARDYIFSATPDASLSAADKRIVSANLSKLRALATKTEQQLRADGRL